jgi:hypothetical protein
MLGLGCMSTGVALLSFYLLADAPSTRFLAVAGAAQQVESEATADQSAATDPAQEQQASKELTEKAESDQPTIPPPPGGDVDLAAGAVIDYEKRPGWVESPPVLDAETQLIAISAGPDLNLRDCRRRLADEAKATMDEYIDGLLAHPGAANVLDYRADQVMSRLVRPDNIYQEEIISPSFGRMHQIHALLEIREDFRHEVESRWHDVVTRSRLAAMGLIGGGVLALIFVLFGYFRIDTATRGYYTVRLQFLTAVAILAIVAAGVLLSRTISWM